MHVNKIYNGDCIEILKDFPDNSIDAILTDPPFAFTGGVSNGRGSFTDSQFFSYWWKGVCQELNRVMKGISEGFIWCDWRTASTISDGFRPMTNTTKVLRIAQMLYHYREMPGMGSPFRNSVDMIAYLRGPESKANRIPNTTHNFISKYWYYGKHDNHPSEKDVELCESLLQYISDPGDVVLDPFCGSGTTLIACIRQNRQYIGIELEELYYNIACNRVSHEPARPEARGIGLSQWITEAE